jgi:hypothetical protein
MLRMVSYPHRLQNGHVTCYLNRTYHVLPTKDGSFLDETPHAQYYRPPLPGAPQQEKSTPQEDYDNE